MSEREFTDQMREISGLGGSYEEACREMVLAGVEWIEDHPDAELSVKEWERVTGVSKAGNDATKLLRDHMASAVGGDVTGAMMQACTGHVMWIQKHGWDEYVERMEEIRDE